MFGNTFDRNMVSDGEGPARGLGRQDRQEREVVGGRGLAGLRRARSILGGQVFVGTNNDGLRNPKLTKDRGVVMAFKADTGDFLWQMTHEKLPAGRVNDWPQQGICSTPLRRGQPALLHVEPRHHREPRHRGLPRQRERRPKADEKDKTEIDGDVVWEFDMMKDLDVFPHNLAVSSPLVVDGILYATTGNGVDEGHINIPSPDAPSFIAVDAKTGELVWENNLPGGQDLPRHLVEPHLRA